ncbi:snRNA-activating protein complex subunit 3-like [Scleropages formosus]|uniref:snRNA-activating protein complex subunit 3 n=1 Tax=Scleropages formosus TaxID=113540 RepID=A0A0P7UIN2_SCLFO|nr:snRNA-activating protein complex subunit 3-like [Scleropages formosus]
MAAAASGGGAGDGDRADAQENVPTYEWEDKNTKAFHDTEEDAEHAQLARELELSEETMEELRVICRLRKRKQDYKDSLRRDFPAKQDVFASELENLAIGRRPMDPELLVPEGEIILTVNVLYPVIFEAFKFCRHHMTLQVMGSQKLSELRDAICCVSDLQVYGEFSSTPDMAPEFISKDLYKSAFFFFEGVFYDDMRYPECTAISKSTIEWAKSHDFPTYRSAKMEETTFNDLVVKIGYPYLYCHQGDCEHVVIITDIRLAHRDDCLDKNLYPLLIYKHRMLTRKCSVCNLYISRWLTTDDHLAPMDPCLFCDMCFRTLHYDKEGNKLGHFLAYPYVDPGAFN